MKKIVFSIVLGLIIYRSLLFLKERVLKEFINNHDFIISITSRIVLPFLIGILIAYISYNKKNLGWLYGAIFIIADYLLGIIQVSLFAGYPLIESFAMSSKAFLYIGSLSLLSAIAGGKCGDIIRKIKSQN